MSKYWNENTKNLDPYVPGEQPKDKKYIKLNTNENPYPPSPKALEAMKNAASEDLKLYSDPTCDELVTALAEYYNLKKEQIFVGNGSDEVLAFSFMAFFEPKSRILFPDITYSFYPVYAKLFDLDYELVPVNEEFSIPVEGFLQENKGIIFPNPNAPTAKYLPLEAVEEIIKNNLEQVVIIDEAYIDFGGESAVQLIEKYPNVLVIQTLSKSRSLAGLRVGFALGHEDLIEGLNRIKNSINSYTLDRIAIVGAAEAIKDESYFQEMRAKVMDTREKTIERLKELDFKIVDSKANFVFISHSTIEAKKLFLELKERGVLVRYFSLPRIDNFLRVSIGSEEEMDVLLEKLKEIVLG